MKHHTEVNAGDAAASMLKATFPEGYAEFQLKEAIRTAVKVIGTDKTSQVISDEMTRTTR